MVHMPRLVSSLPVVAAFVLVPRLTAAADGSLSPGASQAEVAAAIDALGPGDTLTLEPGEYPNVDLDLKHADDSPLVGTASAHIRIVGKADASGKLPHVIANADAFQEAVRLRTGSTYVDIEGLHLSAKGNDTQAGVFVDSGVSFVTIRDCLIADVTGIGIQIQTQNDVHDLLIEHNEIHDTGTNSQDGNNGGQAFTAGGFTAGSATQGVHHIVLRRNLIHHTMGQEGDCMKFMYGVYASTMEDNVAHDCPRGVSSQTENYGFTSYGSGAGHYQNAADSNAISRNLLVNTAAVVSGHSNVAIYAGPGTRVENNVIVGSNQGIAARLEDEASEMRNLTVRNNTVFGATDYAFSIRGCQNADASVVVTNNALFAVDAKGFGYRMPDPLGAMVAAANYFQGQDYAEAAPPVMNPLSAPAGSVFMSPSTAFPGADFRLVSGSPLVDHGDAGSAPADDFDLAPRPVGSAPDVGAYESGSDPAKHWALAFAFKGSFGSGGGAGAGGARSGGGGSGGSPAGGANSGGASGSGTGAATGGDDSSGCGCSVPKAPGSPAFFALAALAFGAALRRQVRRMPEARTCCSRSRKR